MSTDAVAAPHPLLGCPQCGYALPDVPADRFLPCPACQTLLSGFIFPAAHLAAAPVQSGTRAAEGEAVCYFHPEKRAEQTCGRCGRFVCELCDMPIGAEHFCPACLTSGLEGGKIEQLVPRRIIWPQLALWMGLLPLIFGFGLWPFFMASGPAAIGLAIYGWKKPGSLVKGRRRISAIVSIILGLVQVGIIVGMAVLIVTSLNE